MSLSLKTYLALFPASLSYAVGEELPCKEPVCGLQRLVILNEVKDLTSNLESAFEGSVP